MAEAETIKVGLPPVITVAQFADRIQQPVALVIKTLLTNGFLANINETIDFDTAALIAQELGVEVEKQIIDEKKLNVITPDHLDEIIEEEKKQPELLQERPPIVTILGHVDHGKTTLLDSIRKTNVVASESGGITQHITAYQVKEKERLITFIDTPGHEAFSLMRSRGSRIADIAILIVAADDGVRPQTKEVIESLKAGKVPMIVAINKIDKPEANIEMVKSQLAEAGIFLEKRGGDIPCVEISAKNNLHIDELLDTILLLADVIKINANYERKALGIVLESHLDQRRGVVASVIIKTGTLNTGDSIIAGADSSGTVRQILSFDNKKLLAATPGTPVTIIGLESICPAGVVLQVEENKLSAREKAERSKLEIKLHTISDKATMKKINEETEEMKKQKLNIILKTDVTGSLEAIEQIIQTIPQEEVEVNTIVKKVGNVSESDVQIAEPSGAIIYSFKVSTPEIVKHLAEKKNVPIKKFDIIYKLIEDLKEAMSVLLPPEVRVTELGEMRILAIFRTEKNRMIVGGKILKGKVVKNADIVVLRQDAVIGEGKVEQLKNKENVVAEAKEGQECGITFAPKGKLAKIMEGDILRFSIQEEIKRHIA